MGSIRKRVIVVLWGGEEVSIICANTKGENASTVAEKLRKVIAEKDEEKTEVTASFGVAELQAGESIDDVLSRVDHALYQAKESGKNCVRQSSTAQ